MQLSELTALLDQHPDADLAILLPDGSAVAPHFHVTEVGRVRKDFIDCGGTARATDACVLQVWVADDVEHRLTAGKLGKIIELGRELFSGADLPVEIEYDVGVITQFAVALAETSDQTISLKLTGKHTACLAPDLCKVEGDAGDAGCCTPNAQEGSVVSLGVDRDGCC
ncbi:MAG: DUF6428 family protein [Phycisphaeraceae bacterium]